jgi:hypothetical protein
MVIGGFKSLQKCVLLSFVLLAPPDASANLVTELNDFAKSALETLHQQNHDDAMYEKGTSIENKLMSGYDARVAQHCSTMKISGLLARFIEGAMSRFDSSSSEFVNLYFDYDALLAKHGQTRASLASALEKACYEFELAPLYEGPITVYEPGFFDKQGHRLQTFIRLMALSATSAKDMVSIEAYVGAGSAKGRYVGIAHRNGQTQFELSLMRKDSKRPLLLDGVLEMNGPEYRDPIAGNPAPKIPPRVLDGELTIHDGDVRTITNKVRLVARASDAEISKSLNGFQIPLTATLGTYLNAVIIRARGKGIGANYSEFLKQVDRAYETAQSDNPIQSFHPTYKPLFVKSDEIVMTVFDAASDVNAKATQILRSNSIAGPAWQLGVRSLEVAPVLNIKEGSVTYQLTGQNPKQLTAKNYEEFVRMIFNMDVEANRARLVIYKKFGVLDLANKAAALQRSVEETLTSLPSAIGQLLGDRPYDASLDSKIARSKEAILKARELVELKLSNILVSQDLGGLQLALSDFYNKAQQAIDLASNESTDLQILESFHSTAFQTMNALSEFSREVAAKSSTLKTCIEYTNTYTAQFSLQATIVDPNGKPMQWNLAWARILAPETQKFLEGSSK